jgi:hypothetical protein
MSIELKQGTSMRCWPNCTNEYATQIKTKLKNKLDS